MGQMKKLWQQDIENAQDKAEDVITMLIPGNYQSDFQSEIVADVMTDFRNYHSDLLIAFNDEDELQEVVENMVEEYGLSIW
jgi:gamma-glutamyl:cysteine ligase YbdK (ATP-grasp superfamily)